MKTAELKAPFPYPGGKSRIADRVWERLGNVDNYVEPFAGSLAVLLRRPAEHFAGGYRVETVNDANHFITNFWRAVTRDPEKVAEYADWPVMEADLHARHKWLVRSPFAAEWRKRMAADPDHFDAKVAGWWVWGQCCWIGGAWCSDDTRAITPETAGRPSLHEGGEGGVLSNLNGKSHQHAMPLLDQAQKGVHRAAEPSAKVPDLTSGGCGDAAPSYCTLQVPELSSGVGRGDTAAHPDEQLPNLGNGYGRGAGEHQSPAGRPQLTDAFDIGRGVNASAPCGALQRPDLAGGNSADNGAVTALPSTATCDARRAWLVGWFRALADRLRLVRTCYGHWARVCDSDSTLTRLGATGVLLDPPYPLVRADTGKKSRDGSLYATDKGADLNALRDEVLAWCRKWGIDRQIRVALCCYEGDGYEALEAEGWTVEAWETSGGYGNQRKKGKGKSENAKRERLFYSPGCLKSAQPGLFDE